MSIFKKVLLLFFFLGFIGTIFAHPLDITKSVIGIKGDKMSVTTYFHSFEIDYLLKENNVQVKSIIDYFEEDNKKIIGNYIKENIILINNGDKCSVGNIIFQEDELYNILTDGLRVEYGIICKEKISDIKLTINFFVNFPLQTNRIKIHDLNEGVKSLLYKVLTPKIKDIEIPDLENFEIIPAIDSDCDGMGDEDEKIYRTDPLKVDTDGDNYSDYDEVTLGWNPLDGEMGPGQPYRDFLDEAICTNEQIEINNNLEIQKNEKNNSNLESLDSNGYGTDFLKGILKNISDYINNSEGSIFYIFFTVYILGMIHAAGPGHSKSLLVAYTLQKDTGYKKGLLYSLIFSVTHILDILLLFLITTIIFNYIDVSKYTYYLQLTSILILCVFALYLMYKAFRKKKKIKEKTEKRTLVIAFLAGLAPCSFAWSIYFLLLSLGKLSLIIPLIIALGLGILTVLVILVITTVFLKERTLGKTKIFSEYANKISAILILIISIVLLLKILNI